MWFQRARLGAEHETLGSEGVDGGAVGDGDVVTEDLVVCEGHEKPPSG